MSAIGLLITALLRVFGLLALLVFDQYEARTAIAVQIILRCILDFVTGGAIVAFVETGVQAFNTSRHEFNLLATVSTRVRCKLKRSTI